MGTEKQLLTAAIAAACLAASTGAALAAQPSDIEQRRCSNNGKGNGGETNTTITIGGEVTECEKFVDIPEDEDGPGTDPLDPNPK
ncbi:MAG TPA: hypothetical protein VLK28_07815 [Methylomirabilota bacterium]|nr:hypothetical protein [Methylomirabilota bacterium]